MKKMQIAYFGTPDFAATFLEKLLTDPEIPVEIKLVVTQPDSKVGRKQIVTPTPVKVVAQKHGIEILDSKLNSEFSILNSKLKAMDMALLYAFGEIIPAEVLNLPTYGFWNVHPSLLPKYRGPAPMATPLMNGDTETGVTLIKMDEELDHGPIIAQEHMPIDPKDRRPDLEKKLTELGYQVFRSVILERSDRISNDRDPIDALMARLQDDMKKQDHSQATYTEKLSKNGGFIEFINLKSLIVNQPEALFNKFRGLYVWPGVWTTIRVNGEGERVKRLKITDMDFEDGKLIIKKVQLEGKQEVDFTTFSRAYNLF